MLHKKIESIPPVLQKLNVQPLFPTNIKIKDFGYPANLPNHQGSHLHSYGYDGVLVIGADYNSDDELPIIPRIGEQDHTSESDGDDEDEDDEIIPDEINRTAIALFDFSPENDNEVPLLAGQTIWISYRHGQGWLVAEDPKTGENGLVPEEYVEIYYDNKEIFDNQDDMPKPFLPQILQMKHEDDWVDTDLDEPSDSDNIVEHNVQDVTNSVENVKLNDQTI